MMLPENLNAQARKQPVWQPSEGRNRSRKNSFPWWLRREIAPGQGKDDLQKRCAGDGIDR